MENRIENRLEGRMKEYERVHRQIEHVRGIYSQIGELLGADVITELHLYLGKAMDMARGADHMPGKGRSGAAKLKS